MDGVLRRPDPRRRAALQTSALDHRPAPAPRLGATTTYGDGFGIGSAGTAKALKGLPTPKPCSFLALTFGLTDDPFEAVSRAIGFVEKDGHDHGVEYPFRGTVATSNGESIWAFRDSSEGQEPIMYFSTSVATLRQRLDVVILHSLGEETRLIVSEQLGDLPGARKAVPEASAGLDRAGTDEMRPFHPIAPP
jgi:hypothetical protein